ncbi:MAG TPA: hypothetical protein VF782_00290 [Allosphingosinicella sp.]
MSRRRAAALCALGLILSPGCAQRTYVVFPPERPDLQPRATCIVDLRGLEIGKSTVSEVRAWHETTKRRQPECRELRLAFRPRAAVEREDERPADHFIVVQLALDSDPERPALKDGPIVRAHFCNPGPNAANPCVERITEVVEKIVDLPPEVIFIPGPETTRTITRWRTRETPPIPLPPLPPPCTPASSPPCPNGDDDDGKDDDGKDDPDDADGKGPASGRESDGQGGNGLSENVAPALVGGAIVYALAFFNMLPFAGLARPGGFAARRFPDLDPGEDPATAPTPFPDASADAPTDSRVGFEQGRFEEAPFREMPFKPSQP